MMSSAIWGVAVLLRKGGLLYSERPAAFLRKGGFFSPKNAHTTLIDAFRQYDLGSFKANDQGVISLLFIDFLDALGRQNSRLRSPVAVGKCLHLLSPRFFPLWDSHIAKGTGYYWGTPVNPSMAAKSYIDFMTFTQELVTHVMRDFAEKHGGSALDTILMEYEATVERRATETTMLKVVDEYLYVEHTHPEWKKH